MRRLTIGMALLCSLSVLAVSANTGKAFGLRHERNSCSVGCGGYESNCNAGCDPCAPAPPPQMVERTVTRYRPEYKEREVQVTVNKMFPREEKFTYFECVPETKPVKRMETVCRIVVKEVPYTYTVCVPVPVQEKRTMTCYTNVTKEVPYTCTVNVPVTTYEKRMETRYTMVPRTVECEVSTACSEGCDSGCFSGGGRRRHGRGCCVSACSFPCGGCEAPCTHRVQRTIWECVPRQVEVSVPVVTWKTEERKGTRLVCECVPQTREYTVTVCRPQMQERKGVRIVCERVPEQREVTVYVTNYQRVERTGTRIVQECRPVTETRKVSVCQMVPYTTTEKVVLAGCGSDCSNDCGDCGDCGDRRGHRRSYR